jgi:hypothetical protein
MNTNDLAVSLRRCVAASLRRCTTCTFLPLIRSGSVALYAHALDACDNPCVL